MADAVLETIQKLVQDVIAPDVRELKARVDGLEHRMDDRFKALEQRMDDRFAIVDQKFAAMDQKFEQKFAAMDQKLEFQIGKVLAAIAALRSEGELAAVREIGAIRERVAVLEIAAEDHGSSRLDSIFRRSSDSIFRRSSEDRSPQPAQNHVQAGERQVRPPG